MKTPKPEASDAAQTPKADHRCRAAGCPAPASIYDSVTGPPHNGTCRYHDAAKPQQWPLVTQILNTTRSARETHSRLLAIGLPFPFLLELPSARTYTPVEVDEAKAFVKDFTASGRDMFALPGKDWARRILLAYVNDRALALRGGPDEVALFDPAARKISLNQLETAAQALRLSAADRATLNRYRELAELDRRDGKEPHFELADITEVDFGNDGSEHGNTKPES